VAFIALEAIGGLGLATGTSPKGDEVQPGCRLSRPIPLYRMPHLRSHLLTGHKRQGLSDVPRIRIFNDPTTKVADVIKQAYPDRGSPSGAVPPVPNGRVPLRVPIRRSVVEPRTGARYIRETCVCLAAAATRRARSRSPRIAGTISSRSSPDLTHTYDPIASREV